MASLTECRLLGPLWLLVQDEGNKSLDSRADGREGQVDQHEEEQEGPEITTSGATASFLCQHKESATWFDIRLLSLLFLNGRRQDKLQREARIVLTRLEECP